MTHNMGSPLLREADSATEAAEVGSVELEPFRDFEFDMQNARLRVSGYTVDEAEQLLRLFREHVDLLGQLAVAQARITLADREDQA